jgi:hypothetical protein
MLAVRVWLTLLLVGLSGGPMAAAGRSLTLALTDQVGAAAIVELVKITWRV